MLKTMVVIITTLIVSTPSFAAFPPPISGNNGMVVTADKYATQVGSQILKEGGNAIDAAVAVGYALTVTHPCCGNIGGGGFMLIHLKNNKNVFLDFRESAPLHIRQKMFLKENAQLKRNLFHHNALMWGIPGSVKGLNAGLKRYGTLSLKKVMLPAINLAKKGYKLTPQQVRLLNILYKDKYQPKNLHNFLYHKNKTYHVNMIFKQPCLANTLKRIILKGDVGFYKGKIAKAIVATSNEHGGIISMSDLASYQVKWCGSNPK